VEADDNITALFNLGLSYLKGTGVKESCLPTALSFWQRAADLGHAGAQGNIGEAYRDGAGGKGLHLLVHFSAQPKPFWSHLPLPAVSPCLMTGGNSCTQRIPRIAYVEPECGRV